MDDFVRKLWRITGMLIAVAVVLGGIWVVFPGWIPGYSPAYSRTLPTDTTLDEFYSGSVDVEYADDFACSYLADGPRTLIQWPWGFRAKNPDRVIVNVWGNEVVSQAEDVTMLGKAVDFDPLAFDPEPCEQTSQVWLVKSVLPYSSPVG